MHNYHSALGTFPYCLAWCESGNPDCPAPQFWSLGFQALILPYLENQQLLDEFDYSLPGQLWAEHNNLVGANRVSTYVCPSDPQDQIVSWWWKTNAGGVADTQTAWRPGQMGQQPIMHGDGMLVNVSAKRVADVFDGTSSTLFVGEITGGFAGHAPGYSGPGTGADPLPLGLDGWYWPISYPFSTYFGINGPNTVPGDGLFIKWATEVGFSSYHPGGCHFLRVDGSVHFESENMDQVVLSALTTRAGGEVISSNDL